MVSWITFWALLSHWAPHMALIILVVIQFLVIETEGCGIDQNEMGCLQFPSFSIAMGDDAERL